MTIPQRKLRQAKTQVRRFVDRTVPIQIGIISEIFGKSTKKRDIDRLRTSSHKKIEQWFNSFASTFGSDWSGASEAEIRERISRFLDRYFRLLGKAPRRTHALVRYRKEFERILTLRGRSQFTLSWNRYSKVSGWLIRQLFKTKTADEAREFFVSYVKTEDAFVLAQLYAQKVLPNHTWLEGIQARSINQRDIHRLLELYRVYSGVFERVARILVVLNHIRKNQPSDYESLRRKSLGAIALEIQNERRLGTLLSGFNRHVRNSIAHSTYRLSLSRRRITFRDRGLRIEMTWDRFKTETFKLSTLILASAITTPLHYLHQVIVLLERAFLH
jgi:hypothetical protein